MMSVTHQALIDVLYCYVQQGHEAHYQNDKTPKICKTSNVEERTSPMHPPGIMQEIIILFRI